MAIPVLILGESGTGKTASLRNVDPERAWVVQTTNKPLPFRSSGWNDSVFVRDAWERIQSSIYKAPENGRDIVIVDDFQYLMANEFMNRSDERGYDKFTEIAKHAWLVIRAAQEAPGNHRVYFLGHTATDDQGSTRAKTIGKLLDEKITLEGLFTIVLRTAVTDKGYFFSTQNNGHDTVKSPMGLFDSDRIENDLNAVDQAICEYYDIKPRLQEAS